MCNTGWIQILFPQYLWNSVVETTWLVDFSGSIFLTYPLDSLQRPQRGLFTRNNLFDPMPRDIVWKDNKLNIFRVGGGLLLEVASNQNNQKEHNYWGKFINKGPSIFYVSKRTGLVGLEISQFCWCSVLYVCWHRGWVRKSLHQEPRNLSPYLALVQINRGSV